MGIVEDKGGLSSVVTITLIILGTFIGTALLWAFVVRSIDKSTEVVDPDCLTISLEVVDCKAYGACGYSSGISYYDSDVVVKRNIGKGNVTGLRFVFENLVGGKGTYDRVLSPLSLDELQTLKFEPHSSIPVPVGIPKLLKVVALIGKNKDVCPVASNSIVCPRLTELPSLNIYPNDSSHNDRVNTNRGKNCCQYPVNSLCYDGSDPDHPIDVGTGELTNGLPEGYINVCCNKDPWST
jgi:hypothetical protein